nr:unnamed protein product [Callosobruchus chinensis]
MVREELHGLGACERLLTALARAFFDRQSSMVSNHYTYEGKTSRDVHYLQFENMARMNIWSDKEKFVR